MDKSALPQQNFAFLQQFDPLLAQLGACVERYCQADPNACLLKLRQFGEAVAQHIAAVHGLQADTDSHVPVATVQDMARRLFGSELGDQPNGLPNGPQNGPQNGLPIDRYDCIIIDEAHCGYILDREMGEGEQKFRDESDDISAYRRVLDQFHAVKLLTQALVAAHGELNGKTVLKITGKSDRPEQLIRLFKNDALPRVSG